MGGPHPQFESHAEKWSIANAPEAVARRIELGQLSAFLQRDAEAAQCCLARRRGAAVDIEVGHARGDVDDLDD